MNIDNSSMAIAVLSLLYKECDNLVRLIVPPFDTKVTEYLCSGWVFSFDKKSRVSVSDKTQNFITNSFWYFHL